MTLNGTIQKGQIVLATPLALPDGKTVSVIVKTLPSILPDDAAPIPTIAERYKDIIGCINDLPEDFAAQHDHYVHGSPKR